MIAEAPVRERLRLKVPNGTLTVTAEPGDWRLDELCDFAARNNPKRGFLVVSKVLGRHWSARPSAMRASVRALAARVPRDLPGPVLVVGLAETAIALGQTLHEELRARWCRDDLFFIHSTRQSLTHPVLCRFEEAHSHATAHLIYAPALPGFVPPKSLVLVDDEVSTGATLAGLAEALVGCWPGVETVCAAVLTDWSNGDWTDGMPRSSRLVSLLRGRLEWERTADADMEVPHPAALGQLGEAPNFGRLGLAAPIAPPPLDLPPLPDGPLRILGTGEFTYLPFRLAERLEQAGHDVVVQATSRSPARIGGAIRTALRFGDNYGTGVPNFLYNADPADGRATWICHETGAGSLDPDLISALEATPVSWVA